MFSIFGRANGADRQPNPDGLTLSKAVMVVLRGDGKLIVTQ